MSEIASEEPPTPAQSSEPKLRPVAPPVNPVGRPRQPWCPDCLKSGQKTPKYGKQGYCLECMRRRQRATHRANEEGTTTEIAIMRELREERDDLALQLKSAQALLGDANPDFAVYRERIARMGLELRTARRQLNAWRTKALGETLAEDEEAIVLMYRPNPRREAVLDELVDQASRVMRQPFCIEPPENNISTSD